MTDLDFHGPWRDDLMQQQRVKFVASAEHQDKRDAADLYGKLQGWKERAEQGTGDI